MNTKPSTIVHVITSLDMGGAERSLTNLVLNMDRNKYNNIVVSLKGLGHWGPVLQQQGIRVIPLHLGPSPLCARGIFKLWRLLRKIKPDYVQGWMYHANVVALVVAKLAGVKHVYWNIRCSLMDLSQYSVGTKLMFKLGAVLSRFTHGIINNSQESIKQHVHHGYRHNNLIHIPNGFDTQRFAPNPDLYKEFRIAHNLPNDAIVIGMVARFDPMKDHLTFFKAAKILAAQTSNVYFVCAGREISVDNPALNAAIATEELQAKIILLDQVDNVHELYPAFDYLTQTSIFGEGFPNVVAEAMACGVPCFVTDVGDSLEVIGECGYMIEMQDPQALAEFWLDVIRTKTDIKLNLQNVARKRIETKFSLQNTINLYTQCYELAE